MPANVFTTTQAVGNREDLIDKIFRTSPSDTPFVSRIDRVNAEAVWHEWQRDTLRPPNPNNSAPEGADATFAKQAPTERLGNRCQIFTDTFSISGTQNVVSRAGGPEMGRLKAKKALEIKKDIEAACISNPVQRIEDATGNRMLRGLNGWIATNNNMGAGGVAPDPANNVAPVDGTKRDFTEDLFKDAVLQAYQNGGDVRFAIMAPYLKQVGSGFEGNVVRNQDVNGVARVTLNTAYTFYGSDFGNIEMVPNRTMANGIDDNVYGIDPDYWAVATLRAFETEELAKTGDNTSFLMVAELTLQAGEERSSFAIRDLNATAPAGGSTFAANRTADANRTTADATTGTNGNNNRV